MSGKELSRELAVIVGPALRELVPRTPLALAFIGAGSDVLGYDTARSMDHDWGPRLTIVMPEDERCVVAKRIDETIDQLLPPTVAGFPTRFSHHADGTLFPDAAGPVHRLHVTSNEHLLRACLDIDRLAELAAANWLATPMQSLLELTGGDVFVDDDGELTAIREALEFYPDNIWRYQLSALWMRVAQIQPFIGRTGEVGDEVGSAIIAASIARDLMRIALLQSKHYAPYAKWLGSACDRTLVGPAVLAHLAAALKAAGWRNRETELNRAGSLLISQLNELELIDPVQEAQIQFHTRPFHVLPAERIAHALHESLAGTDLAGLTPFVGGIDVLTDSTDALNSRELRLALRAMFTSLAVDPPD